MRILDLVLTGPGLEIGGAYVLCATLEGANPTVAVVIWALEFSPPFNANQYTIVNEQLHTVCLHGGNPVAYNTIRTWANIAGVKHQIELPDDTYAVSQYRWTSPALSPPPPLAVDFSAAAPEKCTADTVCAATAVYRWSKASVQLGTRSLRDALATPATSWAGLCIDARKIIDKLPPALKH